ncbi:MAG TPA: hypothetical protein DCQ06_13020 [Myxococcales bacterium]|nr:hypothetical protein [Myxococcales bacterium]HAN32511.1 hypothetical protein [Myxococcales bacterium]
MDKRSYKKIYRSTTMLGCIAVMVLSQTACDLSIEDQTKSATELAFDIPAGEIADKPWARVACGTIDPSQQLACVEGVAITRSDFERVRNNYASIVSNRQVVDALVRAEILAAEAARRGLWSGWLSSVFTAAMARRLLTRDFEQRYGPDEVQAADIDRTWRRGAIRIQYSHEKVWWITDAQLICCTGDWRACEIDEKAQACITRLQPTAFNLYGRLMMEPPGTPEHMCARVLALKEEFPTVTCDQLNFYYDDSKPYEKQGDFDLMVKPFVLGVSKIAPGRIGQPIRTPYGWHIVRLNKVDERKTGKISDTEIRKDIANGILTGVRIRDVELTLMRLMRSKNVAILYDNLEKGLIGRSTK